MVEKVITIPKKLAQKGDLIILPRREYEELLRLSLKNIPEVEMTLVQRRALKKARENRKKGNFLTFNELKGKLGFRD